MKTIAHLFVTALVILSIFQIDSAKAQDGTLRLAAKLASPAAVNQIGEQKRTDSPIEKAVQDHKVECTLVGDGETTTGCQLVVTNLTGTRQKLAVPAFQFFIPEKTDCQVMMTTTKTEIDVPPNQAASVDLLTVCASSKIHKAPGPERITYTPGPHPNNSLDQLCPALVKAAQKLEKIGSYKTVPVGKERRPQMLSQLAIWKVVGKSTSSVDDDVTKEAIRDETISAISATTHQKLTDDQRESFDTYAAKIFEGVDLTLKHVGNPVIAEN